MLTLVDGFYCVNDRASLPILRNVFSSPENDSEFRFVSFPQIVTEALEDIRQNRTCIVISPTLATAESCQQIYLLQQGRVVDQGKHQELLTRRPRYRRLFKDLRNKKQDGKR